MKMKKSMLNITIITTCLTGLIFTSSNTSAQEKEPSKEKVEKAQTDLKEAQDNYNKEYEIFKTESEKNIKENDKSIDELKIKCKNMDKADKIKTEAKIDDLEKRNNAMKEKIKNYKDSGMDKWESFKREFNHDMTEFGQAFKDIGVDNKN